MFRLKNYHEFSRFFLCNQPYRFRNISQTSELKSTSENVSSSTWFIHFDGLSNYLNLFPKKPAANFFNSCCFPVQWHVGHYTNKFTETELDFFIKYLLRAIECGFCWREGISCCYYLVLSCCYYLVVIVVVVVMIVVVVVQVAVVVVVKSWPELVNNELGTRAAKHRFGTRADKHKLRARAGKYKSGCRAGKYKLGASARAGGHAKGRGAGNTNTQ